MLISKFPILNGMEGDQEGFFKEIVENARVGILVMQDGKIAYANSTLASMLSYGRGELLGKSAMFFIHPDDRASVSERSQKLLEDKQVAQYADFRCICADGRIISAQVMGKRMEYARRPAICEYLIDITAQNLTDSQFRQFADVVSRMHTGFFVYHLDAPGDDRSLQLVNTNPAGLAVTGRERRDIIGKYIDELFPSLREGDIPRKFAEVIATGKPFRIESYPYSDKTVGERAYSFTAYPIPGNCVCVLFEDVTDRRRAEEGSRKLVEITDNVPGMVYEFWMDAAGKMGVSFVSKGTRSLIGVSPEDLMRDFSLMWDMILEEDRDKVMRAILESRERRSHWTCEFRAKLADGSVRWIHGESSIVREQDDGRFVWDGTLTDITGLVAAEEESSFKSALLDAALDSVFVHDMEGKFYYVNAAAYRTRGYTEEELMSLNLHQVDVPEYAKMIAPRIEDLRSTRGATFESAHIRKDGTIMPVEVHAGFISWRGKELVFSVVRDISDRKKGT